mmetsp:Transcript_32267/g.63102  ORF Transcript_32267/g.63102 Transcript_32267/m.63102 type:complete len:469 (+) Transcript_32267:361-1767(+)
MNKRSRHSGLVFVVGKVLLQQLLVCSATGSKLVVCHDVLCHDVLDDVLERRRQPPVSVHPSPPHLQQQLGAGELVAVLDRDAQQLLVQVLVRLVVSGHHLSVCFPGLVDLLGVDVHLAHAPVGEEVVLHCMALERIHTEALCSVDPAAFAIHGQHHVERPVGHRQTPLLHLQEHFFRHLYAFGLFHVHSIHCQDLLANLACNHLQVCGVGDYVLVQLELVELVEQVPGCPYISQARGAVQQHVEQLCVGVVAVGHGHVVVLETLLNKVWPLHAAEDQVGVGQQGGHQAEVLHLIEEADGFLGVFGLRTRADHRVVHVLVGVQAQDPHGSERVPRAPRLVGSDAGSDQRGVHVDVGLEPVLFHEVQAVEGCFYLLQQRVGVDQLKPGLEVDRQLFGLHLCQKPKRSLGLLAPYCHRVVEVLLSSQLHADHPTQTDKLNVGVAVWGAADVVERSRRCRKRRRIGRIGRSR